MKKAGPEGPEWRVRLFQCIEKSGRTQRSVSLAAGYGPNYVEQMMKPGKEKTPSFDRVVRICNVLDISVTYIATGAKMSRYEEEVLAILAKMDDQQRQALQSFLQTLVGSDAPSR